MPLHPPQCPVPTLRDTIRQRLADETGRLTKEAPYTVALASPSPTAPP
jgi:hypothetical protein